MSRHHHHNEENQMTEEKSSRGNHSHQYLNLKPAAVIDHFKIKAKRKRKSKDDPSELINSQLNQVITGNPSISNHKQSIQDHNESIQEIPLVPSRSLRSKSIDIPLSTENNVEQNTDNHMIIDKQEDDSIVPNEDENMEENLPYQTNHLTVNTNKKVVTSKSKALKATKLLPEANNQRTKKTRRQTVRRTGFNLRDNDFNTIFSELPLEEQLIIAFSCAWRKEVFMHGRMFLSVNYICFYTCFFKWEESLCIPYKDIISVTREKSARVIPNAIKLRTKNDEQYLFASYVPREKIFIAIFRVWQNALLEQPLDYQHLRALVVADQQSHDETSGDSEESIVLDNLGESEPGLYSQSLPVSSNHSIESSTQRRVASLPPDNDTTTYLSTCPCESHAARTYADRLFPMNVDTLFELTSGDNAFNRAYQAAQKLTDYVYGEWHLNIETGKRERQVTYSTIVQSIFGQSTLSCKEKQILEVEKPHSTYVLYCEVYNEGMKYADTFYVATRFCMVQRDSEHSSMRVTGEIKYVKNVNGFIKTFIEKSAHASVEGGVNDFIRRLESENRKPVAVPKHRKIVSYKESDEDLPLHSTNIPVPKKSTNERSLTGHGLYYDIALIVAIFLVVLHMYLCYKLYAIDQVFLTSDEVCVNQCKKACLEKRTYR